MALLTRMLFRVPSRAIATSATTFAEKDKPSLVDVALEHSTGLQKLELLAHLAGDNDPFDIKMKHLNKDSTKKNPNLVASFLDKRVVGCICEEDQMHVNWMWLHKGEPSRCECGHWFKLVERKLPAGIPDDEQTVRM